MKIDLIKNDKYIIIPFWIMVFFVFWLQVLPQTQSVGESLLFSFLLVFSLYPLSSYLSERVLPKAMKSKKYKRFIAHFLLVSLLIGGLFTAYLYLFSHLETLGWFPRSEYFRMETIPLYSVTVLFSAGIFLNLCTCGVRFLLEYIKSQKALTEYQLRTLQHQITPHFMFNVLNHIHILMETNTTLASRLLIKYSDILRYQLYNGEKENVALEQDIQFLKDFIAVEETRWEGLLAVTTSWYVEDPKKEIPALLFITFVENAFKHVSKSGFEKGYINIRFRQSGNTITLRVENSKSTLPAQKKKQGGLGLKNIKERLEILYFGRYNLSVEETGDIYCTQLTINH